jgi:hypothetical protein
MKRSEMLAKIRAELVGKQIDTENFEEQILSTVEKLGMKPPSVSEEDCQAIMSVYMGGYSFNQWDEELEKNTELQEAKKRRADAAVLREQKRLERKKLD